MLETGLKPKSKTRIMHELNFYPLTETSQKRNPDYHCSLYWKCKLSLIHNSNFKHYLFSKFLLIIRF